MLDYRIHKSFDEINSVQELFADEIQTTQLNKFFGDFFWINTYSEVFVKDKLFIVASYKDNSLVAIIPFQKNGTTLTSLCDHKTDYNTIFIGKYFELTSLLEFLYNQDVTEIILKSIVKEHEVFIPTDIQKQIVFCPITLLKEKEKADEKFKAKLLANKIRVEKLGEIAHKIVSTNSELTNQFLFLHSNWWKSKAQTGLYSSNSDRDFLNQILDNFGIKQQSFYSVFYVNDEIASMMLLFKLNENRIGYYFGGHNLKFQKCQIGFLHIESLLNYLTHNSQYLYLDFLRGDESYKYQFGASLDNYVFNCRFLLTQNFVQ